MIGIYQTFLTIFFLGYDLYYAKILHLIKFCVLIPYRLIQFRKVKKHYYMFEFCYLANALMALYIILDLYCGDYCSNNIASMLLRGDHLFHLVYSLAFGPLIWAIFVNKDRIYFHSPQHLISVFIHLDPSLLSWMIRWEDNNIIYSDYYEPDLTYDGIVSTYKYFLMLALPVYAVWAISYYMWIFVIKRSRLDNSSYKMSFKDVINKKDHIANIFVNMTNIPVVNEVLYMVFHALSVIVSIFIGSILYNSYLLNTAMVGILFTAVSWHASYKYAKLIQENENESLNDSENKVKGE